MLSRLTAWAHKLSLGGAVLASIIFLLLVGLIMTEIVGRSFFDYSTMLADEYSGYLYLAAVFLGLAYTFEKEGHIRITIVTSRLSDGLKRWIDVMAALVTLTILGYALYYSWHFMAESREMEMVSEGVSETPLYLTQIPLVAGLTIFLIAVFAYLIERVQNDQ